MLHVLWVILKIILIILAIVLGLAVLLVLLVLFAPIRYKVAAEFDDDISVTAKVRFLIVSINVIFEKNEKKLDTFLRICGIKLNPKDKKEKPKKEKKKRKKDSEAFDDSAASEGSHESESSIASLDTDSTSSDLDGISDNDRLSDDEASDEGEKKFSGRIKSFMENAKKLSEEMGELSDKTEDEIKESLYQKLEKKVNAISEKKEEIDKKINRFQKFWNMKCTVKTREYIGKYLISILKHIAPKSIKGRIRYGFDEPCTTGQVTGYISLLPFVYQKGFSVEPDFREKVMEGNVTLKGRIILGYIARIALKRYIWQTIKMARKI
ncbi:MAG: DUF2953 domain-containing protein [Lachnospiraceae bacterium]|nr:DUF2953 domain-containing protein [Lachnospiraceae bacterium]